MEAHDQTPLRHPVRQRFYALGLYVIMLVSAIGVAPLLALGPRAISEHIPDSWDNVLRYGYYPALFLAVLVGRDHAVSASRCPHRSRRTAWCSARCWPPWCSWSPRSG